MRTYRFQLLRYAPNVLSEEFFNVAVLLYGPGRELVDARFASEFRRLRCNPLADIAFLGSLREEFEERRLEGEGFREYIETLRRDLSGSVYLSDEKAFLGGEAAEEIDRLERTYLASPRGPDVRSAEPVPGSRRWIQNRMRDAFESRRILARLEASVPVGAYVSPRFPFQLDYAYKPNGVTHYVHALSLQNDLNDASRLCFVMDRVRLQVPAELAAVVADELPDDTRQLLGSSGIRPWDVSRVDELAAEIAIRIGSR